ncbi:hypothetical protein C8R47DRAFT_1297501 [Mycena vitilis]|nr:hypothetical protein C8R47DRAFT_1297501 [Mycena vitilis]
MFSKSLLLLAFLYTAHAADILTFKIKDYQGRMLDLTSGSPAPLTPIQSAAETKNKTQNAMVIHLRPKWRRERVSRRQCGRAHDPVLHDRGRRHRPKRPRDPHPNRREPQRQHLLGRRAHAKGKPQRLRQLHRKGKQAGYDRMAQRPR